MLTRLLIIVKEYPSEDTQAALLSANLGGGKASLFSQNPWNNSPSFLL